MKPGNVMLTPEGNIKIIDFGIAREYKELKLKYTTVLGTRGYAPPEQYSGQTDPRSDIYALGMTMHHLVTGVDPRKQHVYEPVRHYNPKLSEGIEVIIDKCVQPVAEKRYQNCEDLLYDLDHPELITQDYKKKQLKKWRAFLVSAIMCVVMLITGFTCKGIAIRQNNNTYDALISTVNSVDSYKKAINIYPSDTRAYAEILKTYEDEGRFGKKESDEFLALYNAHKDEFNQESKEFAELNYVIGRMYFIYYNDEGSIGINDESELSERIQKAYPFFEANYNNKSISKEFKEKAISDCYYQICSFYKKFILNSVNVEEPSKADYKKLFDTINKTFDSISDASAYDQQTFYNGVFMLLYDQRASMATVNVSEADIQTMLEKTYNASKGVKVRKKQSKQLQSEIVDNYGKYKEAINRTYKNAEERK